MARVIHIDGGFFIQNGASSPKDDEIMQSLFYYGWYADSDGDMRLITKPDACHAEAYHMGEQVADAYRNRR